MSMSDKVKALLALSGKKQTELAEIFGMSKQTMSNKMARGSWSGEILQRLRNFVAVNLHLYYLTDNKLHYYTRKKSPS